MALIGEVAERILREGRESIISWVLANSPFDISLDTWSTDFDARKALSYMLDYICADSEDDKPVMDPDAAAAQFLDMNISWGDLSGLIGALGRSIASYLSRSEAASESHILYQELMEMQARLFDVYLIKEKEKRRLLESYQRDIDRFPETIAATIDPSTLAKIGLAKLKDLVGVESSTLYTIDSERNILPQFGDHSSAGPLSEPMLLGGEAARALLERGEPYWESEHCKDPCLEHLRGSRNLKSVLLLPLVVRGRTTGIALLSDGSRRRFFKPEEVEIARSFCMRLAVAMENALLHAKEQYKIKETVALLEIARAVNSTLDLQEILDKVVQMTVDLCGVVMCVAYLLREDRDGFIPGAYYGFVDDASWERERMEGFAFSSLGNEELETLSKGEPLILSSRNREYLIAEDVLYEHGVDQLLMLPLCSKEKLTGLFALFYPHKPEGFEREEIEVVGAIAAQASLAIENAALYQDIEKSYFSTVKALAKAIEVKDPYTHGHSERVTEYALMIAEAMNLEEHDVQKLKYAATLHDIGKIGIAGRVLNKAGALTDEEYMHVKTHPLLGDTIIEPVEFLQGPRPIILHHHERYDGKGYPDGLKGNDIPLCARILAVADAFEAMRSDRPYRQALSLQEAEKELSRNSGTQFDPEVVRIFLSILKSVKGDPVNR